MREAIAAKAMRFAHIRSEQNIADVLTKALPNPSFHALVRPILFRVPGHVRDQDMILMRNINNQD